MRICVAEVDRRDVVCVLRDGLAFPFALVAERAGIVRPELSGRDWATVLDDVLDDMSAAVAELSAADLLTLGPVDSLHLRAPVPFPGQIICIGLNYHDHVAEVGLVTPSQPHAFAKLPGAVNDPEGDVVRPGSVTGLDFEAELALVIGREGRDIDESDALAHVLGYTAVNDVSARDWQFGPDQQLVLSKGFDGFLPMGPVVVTADEFGDPQAAAVRTWVNGDQRQDGTTAQMVFSVAEIVSFISSVCTLRPGDVIATGTPKGVGHGDRPPRYLQPGDVVEVEISGIGRLRNRIR